jgi:hypothetical protein
VQEDCQQGCNGNRQRWANTQSFCGTASASSSRLVLIWSAHEPSPPPKQQSEGRRFDMKAGRDYATRTGPFLR